MKIALVHDYLNQLGGGERVLDELMQMFPEADVYTLLYDEQKTRGRYAGRVRGTSFLDFSFARAYHRLFIPLMPLAARSINLGAQYDLIISDTAGFAKGISYDRSKTKHISYIHTPLRYAWETDQYFGDSIVGRLFAFVFRPAFWYVRRFDYWAAQQPDVLLANSAYIAAKVKEYYDREAEVVYPPVDPLFCHSERSEESISADSANRSFGVPQDDNKGNKYYLAAGRLLRYKRFDVIVEAFGQLGLPLKIVGQGPKEKSLRALAQKYQTIELLGFVKDDAELRALYQGAKAFVMANEEDFGLVMAEAQACGAPVIAYGKGGALEIVEPRATGMFFHEQTPDALAEVVQEFERLPWDSAVIAKRAVRFSREGFRQGIMSAVEGLTSKDLQKAS